MGTPPPLSVYRPRATRPGCPPAYTHARQGLRALAPRDKGLRTELDRGGPERQAAMPDMTGVRSEKNI